MINRGLLLASGACVAVGVTVWVAVRRAFSTTDTRETDITFQSQSSEDRSSKGHPAVRMAYEKCPNAPTYDPDNLARSCSGCPILPRMPLGAMCEPF